MNKWAERNAEYHKKTAREIPVIVLERPAK